MLSFEVNFDGLVGPTHNYAGLAPGNLASQLHGGQPSSPRDAALQGLDKMWALHELGLPQGVLPPQARPATELLRRLGFVGSDAEIVARVHAEDPGLLACCYSASAMWAANSATVSAGADTRDGRVHFTPANLVSHLHRSLEAEGTSRLLRQLFADADHFCHHPALPALAAFSDEGAANHTRLAPEHGLRGLTLLVCGDERHPPKRFPARQSAQASRAIQRQHLLHDKNTLLLYQNPEAIDQGVFHNDVIAVGHRNLLLIHEQALMDQPAALARIRESWGDDTPLYIEQFSNAELPLSDAIASYLFNSQLVSLPDGGMALICPQECRNNEPAKAAIKRLLHGDNPLRRVKFFDLRQSMRNGGGPACLRLRVVLSEEQLVAMHQGVLLDAPLYEQLGAWIMRHYRDRLTPDDLRDPALINESRTALDELTRILQLGSLYEFQR
ncbi:MAG: N-succinylarginine dihydrolase [Oceanospirillaceae bacterium]|nr:N-succinylarginine dihydrolase [Oceanospirillaceae bacterium]